MENNFEPPGNNSSIILIGFVGLFIIIVLVILVVAWKNGFFSSSSSSSSSNSSNSGTSDSTNGSNSGASSSFDQINMDLPDQPDIMSVIFEEIVSGLETVGIGLAIDRALKPSSLWDSAKWGKTKITAMKDYLKRSAGYKATVKASGDRVLGKKVFSKKMYNAIMRGSVSLVDAARMGARFGKTGIRKAMTDAGRTSAQIEAAIARATAEDASIFLSETAAATAARYGAAVASSVRSAVQGAIENPVALAFDAWSIAGMVLDARDWGGWSNYADTDALLRNKAQNDAKVANEVFLANNINYPAIIGPLDALHMDIGDDAFSNLLIYKLTELLFQSVNSDGPINPVLYNLIASFYNRRIFTQGQNVTAVDVAYAISSMSQADFDSMNDLIIDEMCVSNDGVSFDSGVPGWPKMCTYKTQTACHSISQWHFGKGIPTKPAYLCSGSRSASSGSATCTESEWDGLYTEWRHQNYFPTVPINLVNDPVTHHIAAPPAGACTIQSPSNHLACDKIMCFNGGQYTGGAGCAVNQYNRTTGVCYNDVPGFCDLLGIDQKSDGPRDPMGNQYPTCYESEGTIVAEGALSFSLYRSAHSCTAAGNGSCAPMDCYNDMNNGYHPKGFIRPIRGGDIWSVDGTAVQNAHETVSPMPPGQGSNLGYMPNQNSCTEYPWVT